MEEEKWYPMEKQPGWEENETKAEEIARQQNVNAALAAQFRSQAKELAGGDPTQSDNPLVKQWLEMASDQDRLASEVRGQAEANYDARQVKILSSVTSLIGKIAESSLKMQRGETIEPVSYDFAPTEEQVAEAQGLGISDDDFRREHREMVFRSLGLDEDKSERTKKAFEDGGSNYPFYTSTIIPNVYLRAGLAGFGIKGTSEMITILKNKPERLV